MRLPKQITEDTVVEDSKYVVFKREEWMEYTARAGDDDFPEPVPDATVIRGQDLFAAPALESYANSIGIAMAILPFGPQRKALESVADYFFERAQEARMIGYKMPGDEP